MFDMSKIGRTIARLRKDAGLTQMGLADAMGISFQAVSNWERGQTMPDIAKLPQLAAILGVSVDELLGSDEARVVERAMAEGEAPLTVHELAEVAPLLPPAEAKRNFERTKDEAEQRGGRISLEELVPLAPFLDDADISRLVLAAIEDGCELEELVPLAPFLDESDLGRAVSRALELGGAPDSLPALAPFLPEEALGRAAEALMEGGGVPGDLAALAPFMDESELGRLAGKYIDGGGDPGELAPIAPFMDSHELGRIARAYLDRGGDPAELLPIAPFIGGMLGEIELGRIIKKGGSGSLPAALSFLRREGKKKRRDGDAGT